MCYHTALIVPPQQLALLFGCEFDRIERYRPRYHVSAFAHEQYPIITADPRIQLFRWGLIPFWTDSVENGVLTNQTVVVEEMLNRNLLPEEYIYPSVGDVMEWWLIDGWLAERLQREVR